MAPPPEMKLWLPWSELNGSPRLTIEEFRTALRDYPRSAILIACARLSTIFRFGPEAKTAASQEINEYWVPRLLRPDLVDKVFVGTAGDVEPLERYGCLRGRRPVPPIIIWLSTA